MKMQQHSLSNLSFYNSPVIRTVKLQQSTSAKTELSLLLVKDAYASSVNLKNVIGIIRGYASLRFRLGRHEGVQNVCGVIGQEQQEYGKKKTKTS